MAKDKNIEVKTKGMVMTHKDVDGTIFLDADDGICVDVNDEFMTPNQMEALITLLQAASIEFDKMEDEG